ncbi:hypothetical protein RHMOL_Rhmol05G0038800 [Rhododendron molle]|uniref:Uncharacterized protein n=1 Tax=Rhododendron molle TaxID=49168 RepID=A0ACC0NL57_RHOML|nr:hypothetical protein RHMOL_Rhmol05G0038800 [Rhododendron molle]
MLGQLEERLGYLERAKEVYELGLKHCSSCVPLWLSLAKLEEKMNGLSKARAVLTMARKKNAQSPELWLAAVRAESRHGNRKETDILMAKALQVDKARSWLNRAVTLGPDIGDFWALFYKFEIQYGAEETRADILKRCIAADPKHGEKWQALSKAVENSH